MKMKNAMRADNKKIINDNIKPVIANPFNFLLKPIDPKTTPNNAITVASNGLDNRPKLSNVQVMERILQTGWLFPRFGDSISSTTSVCVFSVTGKEA